MAITTTITRRSIFGNMKIVIGHSVLSGTTNTGDVATGLSSIEFFIPVTESNAQKGISVNETLPCSDPVTVVTESNDATFDWEAHGH